MSISRDIVMIYQGASPHPSHAGFAESINAQLVELQSTEANSLFYVGSEVAGGLCLNCDVIIAEGSRPLYAGLANRFLRGTELVYLCADHRLYELLSGTVNVDSPYSLFKSLAAQFGERGIRHLCRTGISGVVAVSGFAAGFTRPVVGPATPIQLAHPFITQEVYDSLAHVTPDLRSNTAVTVGQAAQYKGVDLLVDAWPQVRQNYPDAELRVVGSDHPETYADTEGVVVEGFVDELGDVFSEASLYVQPSRMDTFPVSVLEGLRAGLPAVVTNTTGSKSEIGKIDEDMIVSPTVETLADAVCNYFRKPYEERLRLSERARGRGATFDPASRKAAFADAFTEVMQQISD